MTSVVLLFPAEPDQYMRILFVVDVPAGFSVGILDRVEARPRVEVFYSSV